MKYLQSENLAGLVFSAGLGCCLLAFTSAPVFAAEEEHKHHDEEHEEYAEISPAMAAEMDISTAIASGGRLDLGLQLFGKTVPDPQLVSHITARYPGLIRRIVPALGDYVEKDQVIAVIEANNSLQTYEIRAPLAGTVVDKHANPGEQATDQVLMTIANYDRLWVDLALFPGDAQLVRPGMPVTISMENLRANSTVSYLNPSQSDSPILIARVPLQNEDRLWSPGLLVEGEVIVDSMDVDLLVENRAIQLFEGDFVVFVQEEDRYYPRRVSLGRSDGEQTEILRGLQAGERYVLGNSYLIKADLEKEGVEHAH